MTFRWNLPKRRTKHFRRDREFQADPRVLVTYFCFVDERVQKDGLLLSHLTSRFWIGKGHGAKYASAIEQRGQLESVLRRIALGVERCLNLISVRLAGESEILDASREAFELRQVMKIQVEAVREIICAGDCKNWSACHALDARLNS